MSMANAFRLPAPAAPQMLGGTGAPAAVPRSSGGSFANPAAPAAFDPGAYSLGQMLNLLNNTGGQMSGGSPGVAAYTQSLAPQRAATQSNYTQALANTKQVYGDASKLVLARDPGIQAGYDAATAGIQSNARARAIADQAGFGQMDAQQVAAIHNLGLDGVGAAPAMSRTANTLAANAGRYQSNADSWQGFNSAKALSAIANNDSQANSFTAKGAQEQSALYQLLQKTLASQQDIFHPGKAGRAGKMTGGLSPMNQFAILKGVMGYGQNDTKNTLNASKFQQQTTQNTLKNNAAAARAKVQNANTAAKTKAFLALNGL